MRKIIEARNYAKHVKEWAEAEVIRAQREEEFFLFHYGHQLELWARLQIASNRRKSVKLPGGTVGFRTEPPKLDVADEQKLIEWCRTSLPDALQIKTRVMKSIVKDHVQNTGECPEGTSVSGGGQRFYIR
ncbi:MAG TPA: host-nuclease inhibitor Gam family protein [Tepidisphaeraceae bacterium]